jgi:hypothetical protein
VKVKKVAHRKILGPVCKIVYFLVNHEEWADRLVDNFPGLEGMVEPRYRLPFDELNIEVIDYRHFKKIGKILFLHGDLDKGAYGSMHHAEKYVDWYNHTIVYGDKHTLQVFTKVSPAGIGMWPKPRSALLSSYGRFTVRGSDPLV